MEIFLLTGANDEFIVMALKYGISHHIDTISILNILKEFKDEMKNDMKLN